MYLSYPDKESVVFNENEIYNYYYPTVSDSIDQAIAIKFDMSGPQAGEPPNFLNMSLLSIMCKINSDWLTMGAFSSNRDVRLSVSSGAQWQIRLLHSRSSIEPVRVDDYVYFVSLPENYKPKMVSAPRGKYFVSPFSNQEPGRLMPLREEPSRLCTRAGEWALWKVVKALPERT